MVIGRGRNCQIKLDNNNLSRKQTSFFYKELEKSWYVVDGCDNNKSTNGSWVMLDFNFPISNSLNDSKDDLDLSIKNNTNETINKDQAKKNKKIKNELISDEENDENITIFRIGGNFFSLKLVNSIYDN